MTWAGLQITGDNDANDLIKDAEDLRRSVAGVRLGHNQGLTPEVPKNT